MDFAVQADQYRGATLPQLLQTHIRAGSEKTILRALTGTFDRFPPEIRSDIHSFTEGYALANWIGPHIKATDLGALFLTSISDIKNKTKGKGYQLSDDRIFDVFNIMVMQFAHFLHSRKSARKLFGIKKGLFT